MQNLCIPPGRSFLQHRIRGRNLVYPGLKALSVTQSAVAYPPTPKYASGYAILKWDTLRIPTWDSSGTNKNALKN